MRKTLLFATLVLLILGTANAQKPLHYWNDGPLTWDDFGYPNYFEKGNSAYFISYYLESKTDTTEIDGVTYHRSKAKAFIDPNLSWADSGYRTATALECLQAEFDLLEMYSRESERNIYSLEVTSDDLLRQLLANSFSRFKVASSKLSNETQMGQDTAALRLWQERIREALDTTQNQPKYTFQDKPFQFAGSLDLYAGAIGGDIHQYFGFNGGLGLNVDLGWNRHIFNFGYTCGGNTCRSTAAYQHKGLRDASLDFPEGCHALMFDFYLSYGYRIVNNNRFHLTPFVGYGVLCFTPNVPNGTTSAADITDGCPHLGIDFAYLLSNNVYYHTDRTNYYSDVHNCTTLHAKLYATYNRFNNVVGQPQGFSINLQIGLGLISGMTHAE